MFIAIKEEKDYGNDCIIYKQSILTQIGDLFYVTKIKKYLGDWTNNKIDSCTYEYNTEEEARENM